MSLVDGSCLEQNYLMLQVEVDQEIVRSTNNDLISSSVMANTKQTNRKEAGKQGSPACFPNRGKPGGKAAKHLQVSSEDDNNNVVTKAVKAGCRRHVWGGKARIYKRPAGIKRKYRPGMGALQEIRHYQKEYGLIYSKLACARLFREICDTKIKEGLRWQASAIAALQEGFEDYLVGLFSNCILEAIHGQRKTVMPKDIHITRRICGEVDKYGGPGTISMRVLRRLDPGRRKPKKPKSRKRKRGDVSDSEEDNVY